MGARISRTVCSFETVRFRCHAGQIGKHRRARAEHGECLVGQVAGVVLVQVADRHEIDWMVVRPGKLSQPRKMAPPHATAANNAEPYRFHPSPLTAYASE